MWGGGNWPKRGYNQQWDQWQQPPHQQPQAQLPQLQPHGMGMGMPGGQPAPKSLTPASNGAASTTYVVSCEGPDAHEIAVKTVLGEYVENGSNHGRKAFKRSSDASADTVEVYMYYWDHRDGPAYHGWWLGNQLGGSQVWSHSDSDSLLPPLSGWKIPWDGKMRPSLKVAPKAEDSKAANQIVGEGVEVVEKARKAVEDMRAAMADPSKSESLDQALKTVESQVQPLSEALAKVLEAQRGGAGGEAAQRLGQTCARIRQAQQIVANEVRAARAHTEKEAKDREAREEAMIMFGNTLEEATVSSNLAEDAVEKAVITNELIIGAGDDMFELKLAVDEVEKSAVEAQKLITQARADISTKIAKARSLPHESARQEAASQLQKLMAKVTDAQNKLNPLKNCRADFQQRQEAQRISEEILKKLTAAEVDADKAEEATMLLSVAEAQKELLPKAEQAVKKANDHLATVLTMIGQRKRAAKGPTIVAELEKLEERCKTSQQRVVELRNSHKAAAERANCLAIVDEAAEKVKQVQQSIEKVMDAEGPFLMGIDELPLDETLKVVKACEAAAVNANANLSTTRMFIATKLVEAKRFAAGLNEECQTKLKAFQTQLETQTKKLNQLKDNTATRKIGTIVRESEREVDKALVLVGKVQDAAAKLDDDKLGEMTVTATRQAADEIVKSEAAASAALKKAREFITKRQLEAKSGKDVPNDVSATLIKLQTKLAAAQAEVAKKKNAAGSVETRLAAKKAWEEAETKVKALDDKVKKVLDLVATASMSDSGEAEIKAAEKAIAETASNFRITERYADSQGSSQRPGFKEAIARMRPALEAVKSKFEAAIEQMKANGDKKGAETIRAEAEQKVKEAEAATKRAIDADAPFRAEVKPTAEEAASSLPELEKALQAATSATSGAKTMIATKRVSAKRLAESVREPVNSALDKLVDTVEAMVKQLADIKKNLAQRKIGVVKLDVSNAMETLAKKCAEASEATKLLGADAAESDAMQSAMDKALKAQQEAGQCLVTTRSLLASRQREAKTTLKDVQLQAEISVAVDKVGKLQKEFDSHKNGFKDKEQKFLGEFLAKSATTLVEQLEARLATVTEAAKQFTEVGTDSVAELVLKKVIQAFKDNKASASAKELFNTIVDGEGSLSESKFVAYVGKLPELGGDTDEALLKRAFKKLDEGGKGAVDEAMFIGKFKEFYVCSSPVTMTEDMSLTGNTLRRLNVGEIAEGLEAPCRDEGSGLLRVKIKVLKDEKIGYVSLSGNQGTVYVQPYTMQNKAQKELDKQLDGLLEACKETFKQLDQKLADMKKLQGPTLGETRNALTRMKARVSKVISAQGTIKRKTGEASRNQEKALVDEKRRLEQAAERKAVEETLAECESCVASAIGAADSVVPKVEKFVKEASQNMKDKTDELVELDKSLSEALAAVEQIQAKMASKLDEIRGVLKAPAADLKREITRLKVKAGACEAKCKKHALALKNLRQKMSDDAHAAVATALREQVAKDKLGFDDVFKKLAGSAEDIPIATIKKLVEETGSLTAKQIDHGLERYAGAGLSRLGFALVLQQYMKCVKDIAVTDKFEIQTSKVLRRLAVGEIIEVLEPPRKEEEASLDRLRCRALSDNLEGWVAVRGNQGTSFLTNCSKPYYEVTAADGVSLEGSTASKVGAGEVVEVMEGPVPQPATEVSRLRVRAKKDRKVGWVTASDSEGAFVEASKVMVCRQAIALTKAFDISAGAVIRRIEVGEVLEPLDEERTDHDRGVTRMKMKAVQDGQEGWITVRGSLGSEYLETSDKVYVCRRPVALHIRASLDSGVSRQLEVGEQLEVMEGPKVEIKPGAMRMRCRTLGKTCQEGWFTLTPMAAKPWQPRYRCKEATALTADANLSSKALKKLEPSEMVEALAAPSVEQISGLLRVRCRSEKDGVVGYATVKSKAGSAVLEAVPVPK